MTNDQLFYQTFLSAIREKIPHKATRANTITDLLGLDKDAIYRRLRGEVNFSFAEMAIVARSLGISLDNIAGKENIQSKPTRLNFSRQINPTEIDYEMFEGHVHLLKSIKDEPETIILEAGNIFPHYLYQDYEYLTRFHMFRWSLTSSYGAPLPYHEIIIPDRLRTLQIETCKYARYIKSFQYAFDQLIFQRLVANIVYFAKVRLIKDEDVALIKNDLIRFLNDLEKLAIKGKHEDTGNEVSLFLSDVTFDANYSCLKCRNIHLTLFKIYIINAVVSMDVEVFDETCAWIRSLLRMSTLISVSGEKIRATFFNEQRSIINTL